MNLLKAIPMFSFVLLVMYCFSNVHLIASDQTAIVLRFGAVLNSGTPQAVHSSGVLFAYPKPIDEVVVFPSSRIYELEITNLNLRGANAGALQFLKRNRFHPAEFGYVITGDHNLLHLSAVVRYRISDPEKAFFEVEEPSHLINREIVRALSDQVARTEVELLLTEYRQRFLDDAVEQAQNRLNNVQSGVELLSIELTGLEPPAQVKEDFELVQTRVIEAQTAVQEAKTFREEQIPKAKARKDQNVQRARGAAEQKIAHAQAQGKRFVLLAEEYAKAPQTTHERLYRDGIEAALDDVSELRFVPPPVKGSYPQGTHLKVGEQ